MSIEPLAAANKHRAQLAATKAMPAAQAALFTAPPGHRAVLLLRLRNPKSSMAQLGALHRPPISKDAVWNILRRAKRRATRYEASA